MTLTADAMSILSALGFPRAQLNERSALCVLALANMQPRRKWKEASSPYIGITPIMDFARTHYGKDYAPNTREIVRRQTMHQFVAAGFALYNADDPSRPVNSPRAVYSLSPSALALLRQFGSPAWKRALADYLAVHKSLAAQYAKDREQQRIPVKVADGKAITLSVGEHSVLIRGLVEEFAPRFAPGSELVYVGDTGDKVGYFNEALLGSLGVVVDRHGKMPDAIFFDRTRGWLILAEAVTSHGPVDGKRKEELRSLFGKSTAGIVYVTGFPNRAVMARYLPEIAWETEVWVADHPSHLVHFNGERFLGPYEGG